MGCAHFIQAGVKEELAAKYGRLKTEKECWELTAEILRFLAEHDKRMAKLKEA